MYKTTIRIPDVAAGKLYCALLGLIRVYKARDVFQPPRYWQDAIDAVDAVDKKVSKVNGG